MCSIYMSLSLSLYIYIYMCIYRSLPSFAVEGLSSDRASVVAASPSFIY